MINVTLFCRPESYYGMSMEVYAQNLFQNLCKLSGFNVQLFRPKDLRIPLAGKHLTYWIYYPFVARRHKADINHIIDHSLSHLISSFDSKKTVITCHDLIGLTVPKSIPFWKRKVFWKNVTRNLFKAKKIIAISQRTKNDILKYSSCRSENIEVIYLGVGTGFRRIEKERRRGIFKFKKPAILHVGDDIFYKNVNGLIKAIVKLGRDIKFVNVGLISKTNLVLLKKLKIDFVRFRNLSEEELVQVYNAVDLLVYPAWYTGFGLPVLEAMACGCPVICSNAGALPEAAGKAAIMVCPDDIKGLAKAIETTLMSDDLRQELLEKGLIQVKKFSWEKTAMETADIYRKIA